MTSKKNSMSQKFIENSVEFHLYFRPKPSAKITTVYKIINPNGITNLKKIKKIIKVENDHRLTALLGYKYSLQNRSIKIKHK